MSNFLRLEPLARATESTTQVVTGLTIRLEVLEQSKSFLIEAFSKHETEPSRFFLSLKRHLHPTARQLGGPETSDHV